MATWTYTHPKLGDKISVTAAPSAMPGEEDAVCVEIVDDPDARIVWPSRVKVPVSVIPELIAALQAAAASVGAPAHTGPGRPASELPDWAVAQLSDRGIDDSEVSHFIASSDGRTIAAAVDGKPVHLTRP